MNGVVHERQLGNVRSLTDVEHIAAHGTVGIDVVDVAAVVGDIAHGHLLAPLIHEALGVPGDDAVPVGEVANNLSFLGAAVLVLEGEAISGRSHCGWCTAELNALEVEIAAVHPCVCHMEFTLNNGLGAVCSLFTGDGETVGDIQGLDFVRRSRHLEEDLCIGGLDGVQEGFRGGNLREGAHVGSGPGINLATGCGEVVESEHVFLCRIQTVNGGCCSRLVGIGKGFGAQLGVCAGKGVFDAVHVKVVGDFLGPCQGYAGGGPCSYLEEKVVLYRKGLEGLFIDCHL